MSAENQFLLESDEVEMARMLLRNYLELKGEQDESDDPDLLASQADNAMLCPRPFWLNLAKVVLSQGLSVKDELGACQAQRLISECDPTHPLSSFWRPQSEAHFNAIVRRMKEGLPWAAVPLLEQALVAACGFIDKPGLERAYKTTAFRLPGERTKQQKLENKQRCAAWRNFFELTETRAEHFDFWLNCREIPEDYVAGYKPITIGFIPVMRLHPPQFWLSLALRYPDGDVPETEQVHGPAAFSENIPNSVDECHRLLKLDAISKLRLKAVPWPAWNERMSTMVSEIASQCELDPDDVWTALDETADGYPAGFEEMSEMLEEIDTWHVLTETSSGEQALEEEERSFEMVNAMKLRKASEAEDSRYESNASVVERARTRLLRHGIRHPGAALLGPVDAEWLFGTALMLAKSLGDNRAANVYLQQRCAAPIEETLQRIEAMKPYWADETVEDKAAAWERALKKLPAELKARLTGEPDATTENVFIEATRADWLQCFRLLPAIFLDHHEMGPSAGQLLAALPDEAVLLANVHKYEGFLNFEGASFPAAALPVVASCNSTGTLALRKLRANRMANPPIGSGWIFAEWS